MANFIGLVYATLKDAGIDTSKMSTDEAVAKFEELKAKDKKEKESPENIKRKLNGDNSAPKNDEWRGVNTIGQAKKIDPDIVEKKLAANILERYWDKNMSNDEIANIADDLGEIKYKYDKEKVKEYIKNNREAGKKIFMSWHELSNAFK